MSVIVVRAGRALLGDRLNEIEDAAIVVAGDRVSAAGRAEDVEVPHAAHEIDARHLTLIPGFIDAHVHIGLANPAAVAAGGVTTVRDLGWPPDAIWPLVRASRSETFAGPRVLAAGQMLTVEDGYPMRAAWAPAGTGRALADPADARRAVAEQAAAGACVVKVALNPEAGPSPPADLVRAVVAAAAEHGLRVTGHVYGLAELDKAIACGLNELAHMLMSPEEIPRPTLDRMAAAKMTIVPTLSCRFGADRETAIANLERFIAAGGRVVYGTDLGNEGPRPGIEPSEIAGMAAAGMTAVDIVRSATVDAASWIGVNDTGAIAAGRSADLIGLAGAPLEDARDLACVEMVWRAGRRIR